MEVQKEISTIENYKDALIKLFMDYSPRIIAALLLLFVGLWFIRFVVKVTKKLMVAKGIEATLIEFLTDIFRWGLRIFLFIAVISKLGVESSSFVAILGAAGLAIGLSLQGSLSNFAGGMLIIMFKPFKLGDLIEAQNVIGEVVDIQIFVTQLVTFNNQMIFVPNGALSNGTIINYSKLEKRRTDLTLSLSYSTDIKMAKNVIESVFKSEPKILEEPKPILHVKELSEQSIKIGLKVWTKNEDFAYVCNYILENSLLELEKAGIALKPIITDSNKL